MNKKLIYMLIGVLAVITSCSDDFLERPPLDELSEETFWKTEEDLYKAVNGIYNQLPAEGFIYDDGASDNAHAQYPWESTATEVSSGSVTTAIDAGWGYIDKRRCNYFLENADIVENVDPGLLARYKAEVRFVRAFSYFRMMSKFGDIPLLTTTLKIDEVDVPRTPRAEVLDFIVKELEEVAEILPVSYPGGAPNEKGRITRGAALALKARVHLYEGQWQEAADAASQVMDLGVYDLFKLDTESEKNLADDYSHWVDFEDESDKTRFRLGLRSYEALFHQKYEGNEEVILDRQRIPQVDDNFLNTYLPPGSIGGWSSVTPTQELVNSYGSYKTGEPVSPPSPEQRATWYDNEDPAFEEEFRNRDPRLYATVMFPGSPWNAIKNDFAFEWIQGASNMSQTGYNFRKLVDPEIYQQNIGNHANVVLIRYAEVLLTYAEAKNELNGPDTSVYEALDRIRERAGMPPVDRNLYNTQSKLREAIRNERRVELALEGHRYMDIRRWEIAPEVMKDIKNIKNTTAQSRIWDDKLYLMPVPQSEIDLSEGILEQNPGY
ncbi:RagB/SusD family nutrient uptake outer membrane protein [Sinomicrobium weinanense]|uniref:RagB/SusD family nutrient uptake outer membrane protein n=1 Tax=Sinomicrobium weinanense TaxID=2842200 RepID=A0A926Q404_9FLAO|nr:RagB/SusD family nutrient uptake outer membrane protein [Sinomicrobium weinanense]MBC9796556.1 RagB/SusD family nutrient uptake outer membrane protein [Sinomicrobium weinanense]MBU3123057.1 RagB/SusD family nutrient uptake outer membrane protein [Sinomicrobium weinanense]